MPTCFGIVGHGVVGSLFSRLLSQHEARVLSYDSLLDREDTVSCMRKRIEDDGGVPCALAEVFGSSDYILSVVTPQSCREIAELASRLLSKHSVFADLTSTSPAVKRNIGDIVTRGGAPFVEGAILGHVDSASSPVIILGGTAAESAALVFRQYGLDARFYSAEIGRASAFKMARSIFSKGMEAVLVETLVAAQRANLGDDVWKEIVATLSAPNVESTLQAWIRSHAFSAQRRWHEMQEVSQFLEEIGLDPVLPQACAEVFARSLELGISNRFAAKPDSFRQVIQYLEQQMAARSK